MRIFLACADERLKLAMLMLLDHEPGMIVAGITDRLQGLPAQVEASQPDVLILERNEPLPQITKLITDIQYLAHSLVIIYLSSRADEQDSIMAAGADYFVLKNAPPDELLSILNNLYFPKAKKTDQ